MENLTDEHLAILIEAMSHFTEETMLRLDKTDAELSDAEALYADLLMERERREKA